VQPDHVADATPRVEPSVDETQLGLGRRHEHETDGGAEEAGTGVDPRYCSENDMSMGGALMPQVRVSRGSPGLQAGESRDA
jgi:hypothetical protein